MNLISFKEFVEKAEALKAEGTPWHFHMIGPTCCFGRSNTTYALILENEVNGQIFECHFSDRPASQTHQMALLCYGPDFLKKDKELSAFPSTEKHGTNVDFLEIMKNAKRCCANGASWHNHHLPPKCMFSPKPDKHCIVFKDETQGNPLYAFYEHDPVEDLAELEQLFFAK